MDQNDPKDFIQDHIQQSAEQMQAWIDELKDEDETAYNEIKELFERIKQKISESNSN